MNDKTAGPFDTARQAHLPAAAYPRLMRIVGAIAKAGWGHYFRGVELPEGTQSAADADAKNVMDAVRLRETIESLGPTFVKFGQLLSLRRDMLPDAYIDELIKLQDRVPADAQSDIARILQAELGKPVDEWSSELDPVPFAAASMAQVYHATLRDGTAVVVKVQRKGIEQTITTDLAIMFFLAQQLERHVTESRRFTPVELVAEFADSITAELDFRREGRNADRFRENFKDDASVMVPQIFWDLTTARVLTMERSRGRRATEYATDQAESARPLAENLVRIFLTQVFEHGFFHGDPHPGNVFVLADGRLCFHDFGIVGSLAAEDQENLAQLMLGVTVRDPQWVADAYFAMGVAGPEVDRQAFTRDVDDALAAFYANSGRGNGFGEILRQFIRLGQRHRIHVPRTFLSVAKAFMQIEAQARELDPGFDVLPAIQAYAPRLLRRLVLPRLDQATDWRSNYQRVRALRTAFDAVPEIASRLVESAREGKLGIELRHEQLQGLEERIERAGNRLSFSLIIASIVVASAIIVSFHAGPHYEGVSLLGLAGFGIAAVLGLRWAVAVLRSGRL
jgi:ubiquinone biosynthesis protein